MTYKDQEALNKLSGSFWNGICDTSVVKDLIVARTLNEHQTVRYLEELKQSLSRHKSPITRRQLIYPIDVVGNTIEVPNLLRAPLITSAIVHPVIALTEITDYVLHNQVITFHKEQNRRLYLNNAEFDEDLLNTRYGAILGLNAKTSVKYQQLLNIVFDAIITGTTNFQLLQLISILYNCPIAKDNETVEYTAGDTIITDKNVYKSAFVPTVLPGDQLKQGNQLFDGVYVELTGNTMRVTTKSDVCEELAEIDVKHICKMIVPPNLSLTINNEAY
jgi:hypothetical protein